MRHSGRTAVLRVVLLVYAITTAAAAASTTGLPPAPGAPQQQSVAAACQRQRHSRSAATTTSGVSTAEAGQPCPQSGVSSAWWAARYARFVHVTTTSISRLPLARASRAWRRGMRSVLALDSGHLPPQVNAESAPQREPVIAWACCGAWGRACTTTVMASCDSCIMGDQHPPDQACDARSLVICNSQLS